MNIKNKAQYLIKKFIADIKTPKFISIIDALID